MIDPGQSGPVGPSLPQEVARGIGEGSGTGEIGSVEPVILGSSVDWSLERQGGREGEVEEGGMETINPLLILIDDRGTGGRQGGEDDPTGVGEAGLQTLPQVKPEVREVKRSSRPYPRNHIDRNPGQRDGISA